MSAHDGLNHAQFQQLTDRLNYHPLDEHGEPEGSGFSVKAYGPNAGDPAMDSYMVGGSSQYIRNPATAEDLMSYSEGHRESLTADDAYLGGWAPGSRERGELDVSTAYPRTSVGRATANLDALMNDQEAVGEVNEEGGYAGEFNPRLNVGSGVSSFDIENER